MSYSVQEGTVCPVGCLVHPVEGPVHDSYASCR